MKYLSIILLMLLSTGAAAQTTGIPAVSMDGGNGDGQTYTVTLEILALMTMLTLFLAIPFGLI